MCNEDPEMSSFNVLIIYTIIVNNGYAIKANDK